MWIDRLRGIRGKAFDGIEELTRERPEVVAVTEPIIMELLCGSNFAELARVQSLVDAVAVVSVEPSTDYESAAAIFRATRANGRQARKVNDCLIAAVALRTGAELWHKNADFEAIATVSGLKTLDLR